jgi:hypothetical protein
MVVDVGLRSVATSFGIGWPSWMVPAALLLGGCAAAPPDPQSETVNDHPHSSRFTTLGCPAPPSPTAFRAGASQPNTRLSPPAARDTVESPSRIR